MKNKGKRKKTPSTGQDNTVMHAHIRAQTQADNKLQRHAVAAQRKYAHIHSSTLSYVHIREHKHSRTTNYGGMRSQRIAINSRIPRVRTCFLILKALCLAVSTHARCLFSCFFVFIFEVGIECLASLCIMRL